MFVIIGKLFRRYKQFHEAIATFRIVRDLAEGNQVPAVVEQELNQSLGMRVYGFYPLREILRRWDHVEAYQKIFQELY
jgi:hypothetical protein